MKTLFDHDLTLEEAKELIKNGADVNERDPFNNTPLSLVLNIDIAQLKYKNDTLLQPKGGSGFLILFNPEDMQSL